MELFELFLTLNIRQFMR